jgi:hypothetical protein
MRHPPLSGRVLQDSIVELANTLGWAAVHFRPGRTKDGWRTAVAYQGAGWPDLILVRERVVFVEVKGDGDRLRPEQWEWLHRLEDAAAEVYVWVPADWRCGEVEEVLRRVEGVGG